MSTNISDSVIAEETGGCFSCLPSRRKKTREIHPPRDDPRVPSSSRSVRSSQQSVYHETLYHETCDSSIVPVSGDDAQYFFDAVEDLDEMEDDKYPIITTSAIKPKKLVLMDQPETLLMENLDIIEHSNKEAPKSPQRFSSVRKLSQRMHMRASSRQMMNGLQQPRIATQERGFPGCLTKEEVDECLRFQSELKKRDKILSEIVFHYEFEEEPYALCRFLRATKFDGDKMLERLETTKEEWREVAAENFYPDIDEALGCPFSLFLTQYPFISIGLAKNGFPVQYFQAGKINPEGILCTTTVERSSCYFWHNSVHCYRKDIQDAIAENNNVVRLEAITIIDLKGFTTSCVTSDTLEVIKRSGKVADFFPESLHCMLIINAPTIFAMSWSIIRKLIDPRTARRIQVFSNINKGLARLHELVDKSQLPVEYGGTNISVRDAMLQVSAKEGDQGDARQDTELMYVRKRSKAEHVFQIDKGEILNLRVYTRSTSSGRITLTRDGSDEKLGEEDNQGLGSHTKEGAPMNRPQCKTIASGISGPGKFRLRVQDLDDCPRELSGLSRGYFLVEKHVS